MTPSQTPCGVWRHAVAVVVSLWIYSFSPSTLLVDGLFLALNDASKKKRAIAAMQRLLPIEAVVPLKIRIGKLTFSVNETKRLPPSRLL